MESQKKEARRMREKLIVSSQNLLSLTIGLVILFFSLRIYEFLSVAASHSLVPRWFVYFLLASAYDILFVLFFVAVVAIPFLLFSLWRLNIARAFFALLSGILLTLHIGLVGYFANTNIPLGADFYGYSWKEINLTISSSAGISVWTFFPFIIFLSFSAAVFIFSGRMRIARTVILPFSIILLAALLVHGVLSPDPAQFKREADFNLAVNKSDFFLQKTWAHFIYSEKSTHSLFSSYPLYRAFPYEDVLGRFFRHTREKPNLVFIIVEGLGRDFTGEGAIYGGFTPFVDSLMQRSLYWENFLSTAGRTFNVLPSEFGSLPYGTNGFMELGGQMPVHQTLISILKQQGYTANFFYGGHANFDLQDVFLERQGTDFIQDQRQFGPAFRLADSNDKGFSWGYDDGDVFMHSLDIIDTQKKSPRLDIYLTLSTHEPFSPPNKNLYWKRFDDRLAAFHLPEEKEKIYRDYREVFGTLLYFDDVLRQLFNEYKKRGDYERTVFFITGDHRLIPVPMGHQIDRFHVPFIIFSPMLQETRKFSSISTHSDVTPTVLAFLHSNYNVDIPLNASWMSNGIDTAREFRNIHSLPLMRNKTELIDYIHGFYYLAGNQAYRLKPDLITEKIEDDSVRISLQQDLDRFKEINKYVCENNRLFPDTLPNAQRIVFTLHDDSVFTALKLGDLTYDEIFQNARSAAFGQRFDDARVICRWLLRKNPRDEDVRNLLGHTYAWDKNYESARLIFYEVLNKMPDNIDALAALIDIELWNKNNKRALFLSDSALAHYAQSDVLLIRKSKALLYLGRRDDAKVTLRKALTANPESEEAVELKKQLGL